MRRPHFDGFHHFCEIHAIALGENRPFVKEGKNGRAIGVFDDFYHRDRFQSPRFECRFAEFHNLGRVER